jgi:hypothetical protein
MARARVYTMAFATTPVQVFLSEKETSALAIPSEELMHWYRQLRHWW